MLSGEAQAMKAMRQVWRVWGRKECYEKANKAIREI